MTNLIFVSICCTLEYFVQSFQQKLAFSASYNAVLTQHSVFRHIVMSSVHTLLLVTQELTIYGENMNIYLLPYIAKSSRIISDIHAGCVNQADTYRMIKCFKFRICIHIQVDYIAEPILFVAHNENQYLTLIILYCPALQHCLVVSYITGYSDNRLQFVKQSEDRISLLFLMMQGRQKRINLPNT